MPRHISGGKGTCQHHTCGGGGTRANAIHVAGLQGPFDAAFFNAVFGNVFDQRDTLLRTALLIRPGTDGASPLSQCLETS